MKSVRLCALVFSLQLVCGQNPNVPCKDVFRFDGVEKGVLHGTITVKMPVDHDLVSVLEVRINFTIAGPIIDEYRGHVTPGTANLVRKYNKGEVLEYRVHFPATELRLPKVTAVIINGETVCTGIGDDEGLGKSITHISIRHRASDGNYKPVSRPVTKYGVTKPVENDHLTAPEVTASPDYHLSNFPITSDECGVVAGGNQRVPLITNGNFYERGEIPWLVAIYRVVENNLQFICGGTLVSDRHVITDDILILTLNQRVKFNRYIRPACLWSGDAEQSRVVGASGVVAGWGDRSIGSIGGKQDEPQMVRVQIVSTKDCMASKSDFHRLTYNSTLCAGDRNGAGPCKGDSGGGLYLLEGGKWRLRGVVSISLQSTDGAFTCNLNEYVVYTDTAQFLPWIRNILSEKYYD